MVRQNEDELLGEIDNLAVHSFVTALKRKTIALRRPKGTELEFDLRELASESQDFISSAVWHLLKTGAPPQGLNAVAHLAQCPEVTKLDIATLNHDTLIEALFRQHQIAFADGFGDPDGEVRYFAPDVFDQNIRTNLYKLHGSIDWWRLSQAFGRPTARGQRTIIRYGIPLRMPPWMCRNSRGDWLREEPRPVFLCGSYNKLFDYRYGIFAELHFRFFRLLREHDIIVMSGYGWNDRGINGWLYEWLSSARKNGIVLFHKNAEEIRDHSKSFMWHRYAELKRQRRLVTVQKWLSEISGEELLSNIRNKRR